MFLEHFLFTDTLKISAFPTGFSGVLIQVFPVLFLCAYHPLLPDSF